MEKIVQTDICILGGGAAGLSLAAVSAQMGVNVILLEKGLMGGDCLNYGCVPSKALLASAKKHQSFGDAMQHVHQVIESIAVNDSVERFESLGVKVIQSGGEFIDKKTLRVNDSLIKAKRFVIATGSSPFTAPIQGLDQVTFQTNETIFELKEQPKHLAVIGGGPIGCEMAQAFAMLGSKVTVLEGSKILPKDDAQCVDIVRDELVKSGVDILEGVKVEKVEQDSDGMQIQVENNGKTETLNCDQLLVSTGRRANVDDLGLENAGVKYSPRGIDVDERLRSSNKKIYAMGDVVGPYQFTHMASYHAGIVLKNIVFKIPAKVNYDAVPWVTYTTPELAHVGMSFEEAERKKLKIIDWPFKENDRAQAEGTTVGKIKVIVDEKAKIFGVTIVGPHAGELILPWVMAIREKKTLRMFTDAIVPYPTLSEISKRVAGDFYVPALYSKKVKRIVRFLMKF